MPINIEHKDVKSYHSLIFKTNDEKDGKDLYFISVSGIASFNFICNSQNWIRDTLTIRVQLPVSLIPLPPRPNHNPLYYPIFNITQNTVLVSLNSINSENQQNCGYAIDSFNLSSGLNFGNTLIESRIALRGTQTYLYRAGFKVDLLINFDHYELNNL